MNVPPASKVYSMREDAIADLSAHGYVLAADGKIERIS